MVGTLTNQNPASSACKACKAHKVCKVCKGVMKKNQDFMLMRSFNSIDLIGYGGDINQSESCKQCT